MIQLEATETGVRALDHANVEVDVRASEWVVADEEVGLPRPTDAALGGYAAELRFPSAYVSIVDRDRDRSYELANDTGPLELPAGSYLLSVDTGLKTYVAFEGAGTVRKTADFEEVVVTFDQQRRVTLGFRSRHERPAGTITAEPTPEGIATALSYLHSAIKTTGTERSFGTLRGHPPRIEIGEATSVPPAVEASNDRPGVELVVPPDVACLFVLAPLAYYLQASVTIGDVATPQLRAPAAGVDRSLPGLPDLQIETAELLRHVFYLDCLVRNVGPHGSELTELAALEDCSLDADWAYEADPQQRLAAYLEVSRDALDPHVPEWHLSTYVDPAPARARSLPFLLDRLSLVFLPQTSELSGSDLLEHSLDDFYRRDDEVADIEVVEPKLQRGRVHAWLADGIPIDVFKLTHAAFENRLNYLEEGGDELDVAVVLNDEGMADEHDDVARIYEERAEDLPMSVTVHEFLDCGDLADVLEADNDFLHYIGHCEASGLRCPDGNLAVGNIRESNTRTFFLNACGSYYEGMELLEKGSVAGAITYKEVLDKQAATVGTAFARLLVHGFSFARAMQLARRRIMTGKDYAVVGDGTYQLTQSENLVPFIYYLEEDGDDYRLSVDAFVPRSVGGVYYTNAKPDDTAFHLQGNRGEYVLTDEELRAFLDRISEPVVYEGEFRWSTELLDDRRV